MRRLACPSGHGSWGAMPGGCAWQIVQNAPCLFAALALLSAPLPALAWSVCVPPSCSLHCLACVPGHLESESLNLLPPPPTPAPSVPQALRLQCDIFRRSAERLAAEGNEEDVLTVSTVLEVHGGWLWVAL